MERAAFLTTPTTYPTEMPCFAMVWFASWNRCEACNRAFEGMQPTLRQVPPNVPLPSTHVTFNPSCAPLMAATYPPGPPPITTTSCVSPEAYNRWPKVRRGEAKRVVRRDRDNILMCCSFSRASATKSGVSIFHNSVFLFPNDGFVLSRGTRLARWTHSRARRLYAASIDRPEPSSFRVHLVLPPPRPYAIRCPPTFRPVRVPQRTALLRETAKALGA